MGTFLEIALKHLEKPSSKKLKTLLDHKERSFDDYWFCIEQQTQFASTEEKHRRRSYAKGFYNEGWDAGIKAVLLSESGLDEARSRKDAAYRVYWESYKRAHPRPDPDDGHYARCNPICDSWFRSGFDALISTIEYLRGKETEKEEQPEFVKQLKAFLKKWDAEIWADKDAYDHFCICYAAKLADGDVIQGTLERFVNGDDE